MHRNEFTAEFKSEKGEVRRLLLTALEADRKSMAGERLLTRTVDRCIGYMRKLADLHARFLAATGLTESERRSRLKTAILDVRDEVIPLAPGGYDDLNSEAESLIE